MKAPLTLYVYDDGKLDNPALSRLLAAFKLFPDTHVTVTVELAKSKRSLAQLRWLWGVAYPLIAEHCGYDHHEHDRLHYDLLSVRFGTTAVAPLITGAPPRIIPCRTSSDLTVAEMSDYFDWLVRYAAEHLGVIIPLPDEVPLGATTA